MKAALALFLTILAGSAEADVEYHRGPGGDVYGSDGSRVHTFAGTTTITKKGARPIRCHRFAERQICE